MGEHSNMEPHIAACSGTVYSATKFYHQNLLHVYTKPETGVSSVGKSIKKNKNWLAFTQANAFQGQPPTNTQQYQLIILAYLTG